jgi:acetolactate synthase-1/2/3 large subunit
MKVSDAIIQFLESKGIDTAFTVSGGGCIHLIESLRSSKLEVICPHHEQSCLMASEGYFRMKNKLAVNVVTTGPGGTNAITGLLGLWLDSIPSIIISGQVPIDQISEGTGCRQIGDQEFNIVEVVRPMTKYAKMVRDPKTVLSELSVAYKIATSGRPGPVWLDIPLNIQGAQIEESYFEDEDIQTIKAPLNLTPLKTLLETSKKPLVIVGNGIRLSNSFDKLDALLKRTQIPVVTGPHSGVDAVDNTYEYYCGRIGILGQLTSNQIVQSADLLICLGTRLPVKMTGYNIREFSPESKKIFVDIDENEIRKHKFNIDLQYVCDLNDFFDQIKNVNLECDIEDWRLKVKSIRKEQKYYQDKHRDIKEYASFYYFINKASDIFGNIPIVTSNGTAHVVPLQMYNINRGQRLFTNVGCASMGYGLPAAIGACIANDRNPVICIEGDGSIMMNLQELQTVIGYNLPVKIILVNNDGYLSIKLSQEAFFGGKEFASGPNNGVTIPNFKRVSAAFQIPYLSIKNNEEIEETLTEFVNMEGPCMLEVFTHPKERHEPKVGHKGVDSNGKIIPGTLTDMHVSPNF